MVVFISILMVVVFISIFRLLEYYSHAETVKRKLRNAKLMTSRSFIENTYGKVFGVVSYAKQAMEAPLTGRPCACYEVIVEEYHYKSKGRGYWSEIAHEYQRQDFYLEDKDGRTYVTMYRAQGILVKDAHFKSSTLDDSRTRLENFLARSIPGPVPTINLRYKEGILEAGEMAAACGQGVYKIDPSTPDAAPGLFLEWSESMPLYVSVDLDSISY